METGIIRRAAAAGPRGWAARDLPHGGAERKEGKELADTTGGRAQSFRHPYLPTNVHYNEGRQQQPQQQQLR